MRLCPLCAWRRWRAPLEGVARRRSASGRLPRSARQNKTLGEPVRSWIARRDLHHLDACIGQLPRRRRLRIDRPDRGRETEIGRRGVIAEVHDEIAGLPCCPRAVGMSGHAQDVQVAVVDLKHEHDVEPLQRHCAATWKKSARRRTRTCSRAGPRRAASPRWRAGGQRRTGSGSPARLRGEILGRLAQDVPLGGQQGVLRLGACTRARNTAISACGEPGRGGASRGAPAVTAELLEVVLAVDALPRVATQSFRCCG